jgi:hypothetical protein
MLQINNMLPALAEAKHSLDEIIEMARDLRTMFRVNSGKNVGAFRNIGSWDWGIRTR